MISPYWAGTGCALRIIKTDIDSIDAVDLAVKLKDLTGKRMQPEVFKSVRTIRDVVNALAALLEE